MKEKIRLTRKEFEKDFELQSMRRNDPTQFEYLFVEHCRECGFEYYSSSSTFK